MQITINQDTREKIDHNYQSFGVDVQNKPVQNSRMKQAAGVYQKNMGMPVPGSKVEKKHGLADVRSLSTEDLQNQQNYMTLMSNTLSQEDYTKMQEEGFDPGNMEPKETVTILDKIKVELAAAGKEVVGFNDDLNPEALAEALGGDKALAEALENRLREADIPVSDDTLKQIKAAWDMTEALEIPQDGTYRYMVDNELPPEIYQLYLAKSSGAQSMIPGQASYFSQDVQGYFGKVGIGAEGIEEQLVKVVEEAGLDRSEESMEEAKWLVEQGLPVTKEKLQAYHQLKQLSFPITREHFAQAVSVAMEQGIAPIHADLTQTQSLYQKAVSLLDRHIGMEDVRLEMTAQANLQLLKEGFSFDTASIEEILEGLKQAKKELADVFFPDGAQTGRAVEEYEIWEETNRIITELPSLPAASLNYFLSTSHSTAAGVDIVDQANLEGFYNHAKAAGEQFEKAGEAYEPLMTAPRADLGDSMKKAFSNVDAILDDLRVEKTDENRRAIRILGYNRMELTGENVSKVLDAYQQVTEVIKKMTPASTLEMIRDGVNPLKQSLEELNSYLDGQDGEFENQSESYSRFLYKLEQTKQITAEERDSYIGIYRLVNQIETGDYAAIGAILNTQGELNFSNLLSAVRTRKAGHMDLRMDDSFGMTKQVTETQDSISAQINKAYLAGLKQELEQSLSNQEAQESYSRYAYESARENLREEGEVLELLDRSQVKATLDTIGAAGELLKGTGSLYKKLTEREKEWFLSGMSIEHLGEENFEQSYADSLENLDKEIKQELFTQNTFLDVKGLQLFHKQLTILKGLSDREEYFLPMELSQGTETVHLTIQNGTGETGLVDMTISLGDSSIQGHLELYKDQVRGYLVAQNEKEVMLSGKAADIYKEWIKDETEFRMDAELTVVGSAVRRNDTDMAEKQIASNAKLYQLAKGLLQAISKADELTA